MKISDFTIHRPGTVAEACGLLRAHGESAKVIAGGTDLLLELKHEIKSFEHLVSLSGLDDLKKITTRNGELRIGALVTLAGVASSEAVRKHTPVLAEAAASMASTQIRNMGTIGGNVANALPSADLPPSLIAAGATAVIAGPGGERTVALENFFVGPRETVLKQGEVLTQIVVPTAPGNTGLAYEKMMLRGVNALAVAGVVARITLDGAILKNGLLVLNAVAPTAMVARAASALLVGGRPGEELFARAAKKAAEESRPISDIRGSEQYRRELVEVLSRRSLQRAYDRAKKG